MRNRIRRLCSAIGCPDSCTLRSHRPALGRHGWNTVQSHDNGSKSIRQDQRPGHIFFNWYFVIMYTSMIIGSTVIVYVQDSVSWSLGFGLCVAANVVSLVVLVMGGRYYRRPNVEGSPFTGLARVTVAAIKKRKIAVREGGLHYYNGRVDGMKLVPQAPSSNFRYGSLSYQILGCH